MLLSEAATGGFLLEKVFLEISQNSQENTFARVSFLPDLFAFLVSSEAGGVLRRCSIKKVFLKFCQSHFFSKVEALRSTTLLKKRF